MVGITVPKLPLVVVGCDFRNAAVAYRERLVTTDEERRTIFSGIRSVDPQAGFAAIETCNRIEWIVSTATTDWAAELLSAQMRHRWLSAFPGQEQYPQPYAHSGREAARHLLRVVSGLESLAIGEAQIAGQFQRALQRSREEMTSSDILNGLTSSAGRLAKSSYKLGFRSGSHSGIHGMTADYIAERLGGDIEQRVVVAGMGTIGRRIADTIEEIYGYRVTRVNRTVDEKHSEQWIALSDLAGALQDADALVVATGALVPVLAPQYFELPGRAEPLFTVDVGIPRQLTSDAQQLAQLEYRDLDALVERYKLHNGELRHAQDVEAEVEKELARFERFCKERNITVLLEQAQRRRKDYIQSQIPALVEGQFGELDARVRRQLEAAMKQLISEYSAESFDSIHGVLQELGESAGVE